MTTAFNSLQHIILPLDKTDVKCTLNIVPDNYFSTIYNSFYPSFNFIAFCSIHLPSVLVSFSMVTLHSNENSIKKYCSYYTNRKFISISINQFVISLVKLLSKKKGRVLTYLFNNTNCEMNMNSLNRSGFFP